MSVAILFLASAISTPMIDALSIGIGTPPGDGGSRSRDPYFVQAKVDLLIEPNGRVVRCSFVPESGNEAAATASCRGYRMWGPLPKPSLNGVPSHALIRVSVFYFPVSRPRGVRQREPDAALTVNYLPGSAASVDVHLQLAVDSGGSVTACESEAATERAAIVDVVCNAPELLDVKPATDKKGRPIAYVTRRKIRLVLKPA